MLMRDHSFTSHPQVEWATPAFTPQSHSVTAFWLVTIFRPAEGRRLSWPQLHGKWVLATVWWCSVAGEWRQDCSFHIWINVWVACKIVWSLVNTCQSECFRDEYCTPHKAPYKCPVYLLTSLLSASCMCVGKRLRFTACVNSTLCSARQAAVGTSEITACIHSAAVCTQELVIHSTMDWHRHHLHYAQSIYQVSAGPGACGSRTQTRVAWAVLIAGLDSASIYHFIKTSQQNLYLFLAFFQSSIQAAHAYSPLLALQSRTHSHTSLTRLLPSWVNAMGLL